MKDTGGQAFPLPAHTQEFGPGMHPLYHNAESGMTLRDYLAAKAMQGLMARIGAHDAYLVAHDAYAVANAMLKAREQ